MNLNRKINKELQPKERKIFLNNMNSWFSNFVIEAMRTETVSDPKITKNEFMGTLNNSKMKLPHLFKPTETKIDYNFHYEHELFTNDVFIYNLEDSDYKEVEYLIKGLKTLKHQTDKTLIVVSSIMTWARSSPKVKKEEEEGENNDQAEESQEEELIEEAEENKEDEEVAEGVPNKKYLPFKDNDYVMRIPSKKYYHYKMLETLALAASSTNPMLRTYIVCPGFLYGCGEDIFYDYFRMSWLEEPQKLPVAGDGNNSIPTIHILDLVALIKRIIEKKPDAKYIFAVDRTRNKSLKNIISSISKSTGSGLIEHLLQFDNNTGMIIPSFNELTIDVRCKTSKVFMGTKEENEEDFDFDLRKFKWHCEFGIPDNLEKIRKEFISYRSLIALKILVTGPPASGKTQLAEKLAKFYNLPHLKIYDIVEFGTSLQDELGDETRAKIEEERDKIVEAHEESQKKLKGKKKNEPPMDRATLKPRLPDELIIKILKRKLNQNLCRNRGYILDGYPRGHKDAHLSFYDLDLEKAEEDPNRFIINEEILPNNIIRLDSQSDDYLKNRIKSMPELHVPNSHYNEEGMNRRLQNYHLLNNSVKGDLSLSEFFSKNKVNILTLDCRAGGEDLLMKAKIFMERKGPVQNYQKNEEAIEKSFKESFEDKIQSDEKKETVELNENEFFENLKQEEKKQQNEDKLRHLKERERQLLEKKSEVLRRYLHENVIPILSKGIIEVCKELPNDPVDFLADFLFENSMKVKFPPSKYKDN